MTELSIGKISYVNTATDDNTIEIILIWDIAHLAKIMLFDTVAGDNKDRYDNNMFFANF
jgi:hypothetical protein